MATRLLFRITVLYFLGHMLFRPVTLQCTGGGSEVSILGWMLQGHIYDTMIAEMGLECVLACRRDDRCQSFNWVISLQTCEFSNRTKEARPEDFIPNRDRYYFTRDISRVKLGSIRQLPAETCKEIKVSEGEAVSGKYWLNTIKSGMSVLAYCDMETDDVDECTASSPVCDVNANCTNSRGSYHCTCKSGFSGNGKKCTDIDECSQGSHKCLPNLANCTNTFGSYNCTCISADHVGDGKEICQPSECQTYTVLNNADKKVTYGHTHGRCDNTIGPGWFRFEGAAGTRIATAYCLQINRCDASHPGYMNGGHPTVADGKVTRQVCFHYANVNCCHWSTNIQVRNCGSYYVYYLSGTPTCNLRYCGSD